MAKCQFCGSEKVTLYDAYIMPSGNTMRTFYNCENCRNRSEIVVPIPQDESKPSFYQLAVAEALVEDEIKSRLQEFADHAQEIIDYLANPEDQNGVQVINPRAQAGADMLRELHAKITSRLIVHVAPVPTDKVNPVN